MAAPSTLPASPTPGTAAHRSEPHLAAPDRNPSFIKGLFLGELREELVFPFPEPGPEERESIAMVLGSFRDFAAEHVDPRQEDHDARFPDAVREGMAELGLMGLSIPEEYGGFGASAMLYNRVFGEIAAADPALAVYFGAHQSIGLKAILLFGTEEQKQRFLPGCASGETIAAFCLTEPGSGSDAQAMQTTAVPSEDGARYVLNGQKIWISNAGFASIFTVFAKVPVTVDGQRKERVTAFVVDAHADGVRLGKLEDKMGIKASDTRAVFFENVSVPVENRLGAVGQGFKIALEVLNSGRLGLAAGSAVATRRIMQETMRYAAERKQFGRPIASFEMIQHKIVAAALDSYAADSGWVLAAGMVDRGGIDFSLETAACKIFASEYANRVANDALQTAGGIGYSKEYPYEQAVRDARINTIFEGTNEILRALVALTGLQAAGEGLAAFGKAMRGAARRPGAALGALAGEARRALRRRFAPPRFTRVHPALRREADQVADAVAAFAGAVRHLLLKHGKKVIERQFQQERLADAVIDLYLCTAVLSRTTWELARAGADAEEARAATEYARGFVTEALGRVRRALAEVRRNQDARWSAIAQRAVERGELAPPVPLDR